MFALHPLYLRVQALSERIPEEIKVISIPFSVTVCAIIDTSILAYLLKCQFCVPDYCLNNCFSAHCISTMGMIQMIRFWPVWSRVPLYSTEHISTYWITTFLFMSMVAWSFIFVVSDAFHRKKFKERKTAGWKWYFVASSICFVCQHITILCRHSIIWCRGITK